MICWHGMALSRSLAIIPAPAPPSPSYIGGSLLEPVLSSQPMNPNVTDTSGPRRADSWAVGRGAARPSGAYPGRSPARVCSRRPRRALRAALELVLQVSVASGRALGCHAADDLQVAWTYPGPASRSRVAVSVRPVAGPGGHRRAAAVPPAPPSYPVPPITSWSRSSEVIPL